MGHINLINDNLLELNFKDSAKSFLKGLTVYISIVLNSLSILFLSLLIFDKNQFYTTKLFLFIIITLLLFFSLSISTTKFSRFHIRPIIKRFIDIFISSLFFFIFFPLMVIIFILVAIDSKGPIIYGACHMGLNGRPLKTYKFRTMKIAGHGPEITRIGKFLRRYGLDELPAFYNVLEGEMSIVGPRPYTQSFYKSIENIDDKRNLLSLKPGITGLAQISNNKIISADDKLKYDLKYIHNWSLFLDFKIILKTISIVIAGKY